MQLITVKIEQRMRGSFSRWTFPREICLTIVKKANTSVMAAIHAVKIVHGTAVELERATVIRIRTAKGGWCVEKITVRVLASTQLMIAAGIPATVGIAVVAETMFAKKEKEIVIAILTVRAT